MVGPPWRTFAALGACLAGAGLLPGCAVVPRSRVEESHRLIRTLRAENDQLKDTALGLRAQNQDLTQRAVDDGRRLKLLEEANQQYERSIALYQDLRDKCEATFQRLKAEVQSAASPLSASVSGRFESFAEAHPGCRFDRESGVLSIAADRLFAPGTDRLAPGADALLRAAAALLDDPELRGHRLLVTGHAEASPVLRAGAGEPDARGRLLSLARAARVRDRLAAEGTVDVSRISVAGYESPPPPPGGGPGGTPGLPGRRIEIQLRAGGPEPAAPAPTPGDG